MTRRQVRATVVSATVLLATSLSLAGPATADEQGRIVSQRISGDELSVLFQADGLPDGVTVDPETVVLTVGGTAAPATAEPAANKPPTVRRTAVLAIDNSLSMRDRLDSAKAAAQTFLAGLPEDVVVGLITFGDTAEVELLPTKQRADVRDAINAITLDDTRGTALFDAALLAADQTGAEGARGVLLLTDGNEDGSSERTLEEAVLAASSDDVSLDAVYIGDEGREPPELVKLVVGAGGQVVTSAPDELAAVFEKAAQAISSQLEITATIPPGVTSGTIVVTARAGESRLEDSAFLQVGGATGGQTSTDFGPRPVQSAPTAGLVDSSRLPIVLGALFAGVLIVLYVAMSSLKKDEKHGRVRRRLSIYTLTGRAPVKQEETTTALGSSQVARSAVELAGKVVKRRDFEGDLALRLEGAGVPLRPAEWILIHLGVAIGSSMFALLISGGAILPTVLGLLLGVGLPFGYLILKESRRSSAFLAQLPDTLQLVAGSLSAGYSMPQAMDTVVRESTPPISGEFNRALVEARLGVPLEDAMDGIAERMKSKDFAWVVMAIRIQREVGGNLSELLTTVAATLRERERLRRQVRVLSAEGRLSAWILGLLPPVFATYLLLVQPAYLQPLVSETLGWLMIAFGLTLLTVGALWMRKAVKVEV